MPLVVFKRTNKQYEKKCLKCEHFIKLNDDVKKYPKTVAITCNAISEQVGKCYNLMWVLVK